MGRIPPRKPCKNKGATRPCEITQGVLLNTILGSSDADTGAEDFEFSDLTNFLFSDNTNFEFSN